MDKIQNARIEKTYLGNDDYGYMSYWLGIEKESGTGQAFGTHDLRFYGIDLIDRILTVTGAGEWDNLVDTLIRIKVGTGGTITDIGHIMEDSWLNIDKIRERIERNAN